MGVAVAAQIGWGTYPVMLRYLQTVSGLPGFSMLAAANLLILLLVAVTVLPRIDKSIFRQKFVWMFALLVVMRGISNMLAVRFTLAVYAQLIYLMTPFVVAFISSVLLREQLPRHTIKALLVALVGAVLIVGTGVGETAVSPQRNDLLGMALALLSTIILAFYMIAARRSAQHNIPVSGLLVAHLSGLFSVTAVTSLIIGEDLSVWGNLQASDWLAFLFLAFGILLGANIAQIRAIQRLGAPLVSSTMALRLVSSLVFAGLLLGEWLKTGWQLGGAILIVATVTWYLRQQRAKKQLTINR